MEPTNRLFTLLLVLLSFNSMNISAQVVEWIAPVPTITYGIDYDQFDNSFTIGSFSNTVTVASNTYTSNGSSDIMVIKNDAAGNIVWATSLGSNLADYPADIVYDGIGNVWITGQTEGNFSAGTFNLTAAGQGDAFVVKLNAATGAILFASLGGGSDNDLGTDISADGAGNVYLVGDCRSTNFNWGSLTLSTLGSSDVFLVKLNSTGVPQWISSIGGTGGENTYCMALDGNGNSYIAGAAFSPNILFNSTSVVSGTNDHFYAKFDNNGNYVWSALSDGGGNIYDLAVDNFGNCYFTGPGGTSTFGSISIPPLPVGHGVDILLGKINANGTFSWAQLLGGLGYAEGSSLDCDNAGNVFLAGHFHNQLTIGTNLLSNSGGSSAGVIAKIDSGGNAIWSMASRASTGFQYFKSVRLTNANKIFIAGLGGDYIALGTDSAALSLGFAIRMADSANEIKGNVFADVNNDGILNNNEIGILNTVLSLNASSYWSNSNTLGDYRFYTPLGVQSVSIPTLPLYHTLTTASTQSANFTGLGLVDSANHFGLYPTPNMNDLRIDLTAINKPKAGNILAYKLTYKNIGTTTLNASLSMNSDMSLTFSGSNLTPATQAGQATTWNIGNLAPQANGAFNVYFTVPTTMQVGDPITTSATLNPTTSDQTPNDNIASTTKLVVGPFDPNYKDVDIDTFYNLSGVSYLTYEIHFQNVGNAAAENVLLMDTILSTYLDMSSIELISSSHSPVSMQLEKDNLTKFYFPDIQLPDSTTDLIGSMGFVKFRIKQDGSLPVGSTIDNFADIYFDYEAPIRTNTITTVHLFPTGTEDLSFENTPVIYPNPTNGNFAINLNEVYQNVKIIITDLNGSTIKADNYSNSRLINLDLKAPSGIYLLQIESAGKKASARLIKE